MALVADTKDCTALSDTELEEMANMCVDGPAGFDIGIVSKQKDAWVLISQVRDGNKLFAFSFYTLERIGGTPCLLIGLASIKRHAKREAALRSLLIEQYHKSLMAFPDEDVVVGTRFMSADAFLLFRGLQDIVPRPDYSPTGEERQWVRRLGKRFGSESATDVAAHMINGDGSPQPLFDYETLTPEKIDKNVEQFFTPLSVKRHDALIAFGWAMAEDLAAGKLGK